MYKHVHSGTDDMDTALDGVRMYMAYLALQKSRYNVGLFQHPVDLQRRMARVNPSNIGIVVAKVNMGGVSQASHKHAEREIRVFPDDVVKIVKVI
jgi:hypothetical protein